MSFSHQSLNSKADQTSTKIVVIGTYFGNWPVWFPAFLLSCAKNERIEWLFFTDCEIPRISYANIKFEKMDLEQLNNLASKKLGFPIHKSVYSHIDLRPAFGVIFEDYIKGFGFWGHCDIDVVWGDVRNFINEVILQDYDIISCRKDFLSGHLTLWRNVPEINSLFRCIPAYREIFSSNIYYIFDEAVISTFLQSLIAANRCVIRVYWPEQIVTWFLGFSPYGWYWDNGKVFDGQHHEHIYIHFQEWKSSFDSIDFQIGDQPANFKFFEDGIRSRKPIRSPFDLRGKRKGQQWKMGGFVDKNIVSRFVKSLRILKNLLLVRNIYWAQELTANSINAKDVQHDWKTGRLFLKLLDLNIDKQHHYILESYYSALLLVDQQRAKFYFDGQGKLYIEVAKLQASIPIAKDILTLKELLVDGIYNIQFSHPTVLLDIRMDVGLTSIFFASHPNVVVVGYEPCNKQYSQALHNISLNPELSNNICTFRSDIGDVKFKSIAMYHPKKIGPVEQSKDQAYHGRGPKFEYEEVEIQDVSEILDSIVANYPGRDVIVKIDYNDSDYYIGGISEDQLINKLRITAKLDLIDVILLKWHKPKPENDPPEIGCRLSDNGFKTILLKPSHPYEGMLYAFKGLTKGLSKEVLKRPSYKER